jgi:phosphopentomutase
MSSYQRVYWIVIDGVGAGEAPDAKDYGDIGANTLSNCASAYIKKTGNPLNLPTLQKMGVSNITPLEGVPALKPNEGMGSYGKAIEVSSGKDTTTGHWEKVGILTRSPFQTFPNGFPEEILNRWIKENELPGVLGNKVASGTQIIQELGQAHIQTGKPIVYTSADSVWQVAAHEETFGLARLMKICESARKICDELNVSRVIARPFVGDPSRGIPFRRTYNRKDFSLLPPHTSYLNLIEEAGYPVLGIGKISNIFAGVGVTSNIDTHGNTEGLKVLLEQAKKRPKGLIFVNLIDTDMLYGHRRDVIGFGKALEEFDHALGLLLDHLTPDDLLLISADHGNDPTYKGTDHTREYSPIFAWSGKNPYPSGATSIGIRQSFADIGATATQALLGPMFKNDRKIPGESFLNLLEK